MESFLIFVCFFFVTLRSNAKTGRVLSELGRSYHIGRGVSRDRKAREPERVLQRSVQGHVESGRVVRGEYRAINNATGNGNVKITEKKNTQRKRVFRFGVECRRRKLNYLRSYRPPPPLPCTTCVIFIRTPPYSVPRYEIQIVCRGRGTVDKSAGPWLSREPRVCVSR